jgi:hypothetical protein
MFGSRALMGVLRSAVWNEQPRRATLGCVQPAGGVAENFIEVVIACLSSVYS